MSTALLIVLNMSPGSLFVRLEKTIRTSFLPKFGKAAKLSQASSSEFYNDAFPSISLNLHML